MNPDAKPQRIQISVAGVLLGVVKKAEMIAPVSLFVKASLANPDAIRIIPAAFEREGACVVLQLPRWSVCVMELPVY